MIRKLLIFSGVAGVLSLACLGGGAALVSQQVGTTGWNWDMFHEGHHFGFRKGYHNPSDAATNSISDAPGSKTLTWTGGDHLAVDLPADVTFTQGPVASVTVSGPQSLIDQVRLTDGRLDWADDEDQDGVVHFAWNRHGFDVQADQGQVQIAITAPDVRAFALNGSGDLQIEAYNQPSLDVHLAGSGGVKATGSTQTLHLNMAGSGDADLGGLTTTDSDINIAGSGDAALHASGKVRVKIVGSGDVSLHGKPASLDKTVIGSGTVDQSDE
ncbi:DUF2807 domain-containing protein [Asticcacaulis sp. EMRT-3]|uniref:GIN domain-containing protein n=1 Tax=Asticcacaulis sp. EMRT-3 TaxID=3040349 RepID=UPI0024AFA8AC|nr:DUF2807 domain-containing protein [Asticcacaulis sp. EMRT-3]MDI7776316.1 DUF2807 domain-containing protein [Asticcacaulis sp. EMRT-3]